jgi:ribosomal protein S18 acetylase RimI-like enzyme
MPQDFTVRTMREDDLAAVLALQALCYPPALQEPAAVVLARLRAAPSTTLVACAGEKICAYLFAYPSRLGHITPLDAPFAPAPLPDTLYLHDLAVAPQALGHGLGRRLAQCLLADAAARGLAHAALVSVQDTQRFWEGLGFRAAEGRPPCRVLAAYPDGALYMTRRLAP